MAAPPQADARPSAQPAPAEPEGQQWFERSPSGDSGPPAMTSPARSTSPPVAGGQAVGVLMARRTFDVGIGIIEILVPPACWAVAVVGACGRPGRAG
jgi:hypothetical protein